MQAKDNKMEHIGKIVAYLILAINAFFVGTLILSAYSPYLNPKLNPLSSGLGLAFPLFLVINIAFIIFWVYMYHGIKNKRSKTIFKRCVLSIGIGTVLRWVVQKLCFLA